MLTVYPERQYKTIKSLRMCEQQEKEEEEKMLKSGHQNHSISKGLGRSQRQPGRWRSTKMICDILFEGIFCKNIFLLAGIQGVWV